MGLREEILDAEDRKIIRLEVPEWGRAVWVRTMDGTERDRFEERQINEKWKDLRARLAVATVCDESGQLLFAPGDVERVGKKNSHALDRIFALSSKLNHLTAEDIEDLKKNSEAMHSSASNSSSPSLSE